MTHAQPSILQSAPAPSDDVQRLRDELAGALQGEVRFDAGSRALYSADASNYRQVPIGVVLPKSADDIIAAVAICRRHGVPLLMRGGGTSQNGQCVNVAVVLDTSKYMNRVLAVDPVAETALVEPGAVCDTLRNAAERHGLTFAPDPATHNRCTLGGMIGNNSCGAHSVMAGKTVENIEALEILTYDGERFWVGPTPDAELQTIIAVGGPRAEIYARLNALRERHAERVRAGYPKLKRRVSGYNLDQLLPENGFNVARALVGTEGTCAIVLQAKVKLVHSPPCRVLLVLGFPDIYQAGDAAPEFMRFGPIAVEGLDKEIIHGLRERGLRANEIALLPAGEAWVIAEFGDATTAGAIAKAQAMARYFERKTGTRVTTRLVDDAALQARIWAVRETGASATALSLDPNVPDPVAGWEDAAVEPERLGDYLRAFQTLVDRYGYRTCLYGHFGDGCVHARITFDLRSQEGVQTWRRFLREAAQLVVDFGGSLSGEHGDGQAKAEFLPIMFGPELMDAMREFKSIWDPQNKMNPGKLIDPYRVDEHLRLGPDYRPLQPATHFAFRTREGDGFARQMERCIGMGRCRSQQGGTMCPSYRGTLEERYSTRGRARLLFEMLQGEVIVDRWASDAVREALDTCLSCKGCKSDCPTHVDMASYKAEFLSHYYETHRRPRQAWGMGMIGRWSRWASQVPWLANFFTQTPGLRALSKRIAGVAAQRQLPRFANKSFRDSFTASSVIPAYAGIQRRAAAQRKTLDSGVRRNDGTFRTVLLWVDTFSNCFQPQVAHAAVEVLRDAGCRVVIPSRPLCCGRPLYDFGMLDLAKAELTAMLDTLDADIADDVPVIGLEPGCLSVFKDELLKLFPDDPRAQRLAARSWLFADYLHHIGYQPPKSDATVLLHDHCHQKALFGSLGETELLRKMGVRYKQLDSGCCGMAGAFGYHAEHYALSRRIGELSLLPAVRDAAKETLIITDGFSCREQIAHGTGRRAMHIAEFIQLARENAGT